jgi:hypothetical protein
MKHRIKDHQVATPILAPFKPHNRERVSGLLEIDWRKQGFEDIGAIVGDGRLLEVLFNGVEELFVGLEAAVRGIAEDVDGAVDL